MGTLTSSGQSDTENKQKKLTSKMGGQFAEASLSMKSLTSNLNS